MKPSQRLAWLDAFRGLAVLWMIETHVVNAFLAPQFRLHPLFWWLNFCNGLVAPAFLFIAGYAQGASGKGVAPSFPWKKLRRAGEIALIGYALHFPLTALLRHGLDSTTVQTMWQCDILQCLAVSLGMLMVLSWFCRSADIAASILLLIAIAAAPSASSWHLSFPPVAAFINQDTGSLFPLFPWTGFVCAGLLASRCRQRIAVFVAAAPLCEIVMRLGNHAPLTNANPFFFFERLGWVLALAATFALFARWFSFRLLTFAGRHSLLIYVVHLLAIYFAFTPAGSLATLWGQRQSPAGTAALFGAIMAIAMGSALLDSLRRKTRGTPESSPNAFDTLAPARDQT